LIIKTLRLYREDYTFTHKRQMIQTIPKYGTKIFFFSEILKSRKIFIFSGRDRRGSQKLEI
jgi:hypothetical protein